MTLWTGLRVGIWRQNGKNKEHKKEKNSISESKRKDNEVRSLASLNQVKTHVLYDGENHITMGTADSDGVVIADIGIRNGPKQEVHVMGLSCTPIRILNKWYKMTVSSLQGRENSKR